MNKKHTFIIMGRSGCGKGTQTKLLMEYISGLCPGESIYSYVSGDHFRKFIKEDTFSAKLSRNLMAQGELQPNFLAVLQWVNSFIKNLTGDEHIFIDGSPRALIEAEALDSAMKFYSREKPTVILIDLSKDESRKRLHLRRRADDTDDSIEQRVNWFDTEVMPAVEFFKKSQDYNFIEVNGENTIEGVHSELISKLNLS